MLYHVRLNEHPFIPSNGNIWVSESPEYWAKHLEYGTYDVCRFQFIGGTRLIKLSYEGTLSEAERLCVDNIDDYDLVLVKNDEFSTGIVKNARENLLEVSIGKF